MDKTLLNQKVSDWKKACEFFSQRDVQQKLSNEERDAVLFLMEYWKRYEFDKAACDERISLLKRCDKLHSADLKIIEMSKSLRGAAAMFYTQDAITFNEFRMAMGHKPITTPTTQQNTTPHHDEAMMLINVEKWIKAYQFLKREDIIALLDTSEFSAIEILGDMWRRPKYSPDMKSEAEELTKVLVASHKLHSANREIIEHSKNVVAVARKIYENEKAFSSFKTAITKYIKEHKPPQRETPTHTPTPRKTPTPRNNNEPLIIGDVVWGNGDKQGNPKGSFDKVLYTNTYYIQPRLIVTSNYHGSEEIEVILRYSDGNSDTYTSDVDFHGKGDYTLSGWGSESGMAYSQYTYIDYTFRCKGKTIWSGRLNIKRDPSLPTSPTISAVQFAAVDKESNIIVDYGRALPTGIQYLKPRITISNDFYGKIKLELLFEYSYKQSESFTTEVNVSGNGTYTLPGWGNENGTAYANPQTVKVSFLHEGRRLHTETVHIGGGDTRAPRRDTPRYDNPRRTSTSSESGWQRFNDKIESIGEWLEDNTDTVSAIITGIICLIWVLAIIVAWVQDGFWVALLTGVIGAFIGGIAIWAASIVTAIAVWVLRFVFLNAWTFLIALAIVIGTTVLPAAVAILDSGYDYDYYNQVVEQEFVEPETTTYVCTANSLNIRSSANNNASLLGSLKKNDRIEVIDTENGFAHFIYLGNDAYVSLNYVVKLTDKY